MRTDILLTAAMAAMAAAIPHKSHKRGGSSKCKKAVPVSTIPVNTNSTSGGSGSGNSTSIGGGFGSGNGTFSNSSSGCFPYGGATLPKDNSKPNVPLDQWWCSKDQVYGFQGFSYPLESSDCSDPSNGFDQMNKDFARMKKDFGATIVRMYLPACPQASVFENAIKAGIANDMAVIPMVWFNFGDGDIWKQSVQAIYSAMEGDLKDVAPYVIHSADFGDEPVGDSVDGGGQQFASDFAVFVKRMNSYGVMAGISEDWDRPGTLTQQDQMQGLNAYGKQLKNTSDYVHAHIMPFYHGNLMEDQTWSYITGQMDFYQKYMGGMKGALMITETQWAWGPTQHYPNHNDVGVPQYTAYWEKYDAECEYFKQAKVGWFLHAWRGEGTFDIVKDDNSYVIPNYRPRKC